MTGAIVVTTISYFILTYLIELGQDYSNYTIPFFAAFAPYTLAGFLGGVQFVRTEWKVMTHGAKLLLAFKSFLAVTFAPLVISLVLALPTLLLLGFGALMILPEIVAFFTFSHALWGLITILIAVPCLFAGIGIGQWSKARTIRS